MVFLLLATVVLHGVADAEGSGNFRLKAEVTTSPGRFRLQPEGTSRLRDESFASSALQRQMKYRVLLPQGYDSSQSRYPVLYLLHGLTGDYKDWTTRTNIAEYSRTLRLIIVMPDGENGWYTNAADGSAKFEDYLATDLATDVAAKYRVVNSRYGRAVAGLSMGGFGALKLALKRPALFSVAGSFSGAFDATREGELERLIGGAEAERLRRIFGPADSPTRRDNDVFTLAAALPPAGAPYVYVDCGTSDTFLASNRQFIEAISKSGSAYEYHEVAGGHSWDYWDRRIREFLQVLMKRMANE